MKPPPRHTYTQATTSLEGYEGTGQLSKGNHGKQKAGGCILLSGVQAITGLLLYLLDTPTLPVYIVTLTQ